MATSIGDLFARLTLQSTQFQKELRGASKLVDQQARFMRRALAGIGVGFTLRAVIDATVEQERALKLTENAIRATGRTGRVSAQELAKFASEMQRATTFADEQVLSISSLLLRYRNIGEQILPRATKAILDFAAATGRDATSAVSTLGRAFNDPIKGLTLLTRAGVALTPAVRENIKALTEQGRIFEAQTALAEGLEGAYKGAAEAARATLGGALTALKNAFGELLELDALPGVRVEIEEIIKLLGSKEFRSAADEIGGALVTAFRTLAEVAQLAGENLRTTGVILAALVGLRIAGPIGAVAAAFAALAASAPSATKALEDAERAWARLAAARGGPGQAAAAVAAQAELLALETQIESIRARAAAAGGLSDSGLAKVASLERAVAVIRAELALLPPASSAAAAGLENLGEISGDAAKALAKTAEEARKAKLSLNELLAGMEQGAVAAQKMADATEIGAFAVDALEREAVVAAAGMRALGLAIEAGLTGPALQEAVANAERLATEIHDLENQAKASASAAEALAKTADDIAADQVEAAEKNAEAMAEPFRNAFEDMQRTFTDTFVSMLDGNLDSWKDFWSSLKTIALRMIANLLSTTLFKRFAGAFAGNLAPGADGSTATAGGIFGGIGITDSVKNGVVAAFKQLGVFLGGTLGGPAAAANTGSSFGSFAASTLGNIGTIIAGAFIGQKLVGALKLANDTKLEKIGLQIGSALGSIVGSYYGPVGSAIGGFLGGSAVVGQAQVIHQLKTGNRIFEAPNRLQAINRGAQIGGPIGAIVGAIRYKKLKTNLSLVTGQRLEDLPDLLGGTSAIEGAFGFIGATDKGKAFKLKHIEPIIRAMARFDTSLAQFLSESEIALVAASDAITTQQHKHVKNSLELYRRRSVSVLTALGIPTDTISELAQGTPDVMVEKIGAFLNERKAIIDLVEELRNFGEAATESDQALERISKTFDQIKLAAPDFGIALEDATQLKAEAIRRVVQALNDSISDQILALTDPIALQFRELERVQEERLKEARAAGINLVEVERLSGIERAAVLEAAFEPLDQLLDQIRIGAGILPGAQVAANTEEAFRTLASQVSAGIFVDPAELATSARTFLDASRAINASSAAFFDDLTLVQQVLEAAKLNLPGFASGGSFRIPGSGRDNVVPLFRVSGGETVSVRRGVDGSSDGGATAAELRALRRDLGELVEVTRRNQSELIRLARRTGTPSSGGTPMPVVVVARAGRRAR